MHCAFIDFTVDQADNFGPVTAISQEEAYCVISNQVSSTAVAVDVQLYYGICI